MSKENEIREQKVELEKLMVEHEIKEEAKEPEVKSNLQEIPYKPED